MTGKPYDLLRGALEAAHRRYRYGAAMVRYREAWLVAGIRDAINDPALPGYVEPLHHTHANGDMPELLTAALQQVGFVTEVPRPAWIAMSEGRRPLAVLVANPIEAESLPGYTTTLTATLRRLLDLSYLLHGSVPTFLGGALEVEQAQTESMKPGWRTLGLYAQPGEWPGGALRRRLPDGLELSPAPTDVWWRALDQDPRLTVWLALARAASGHETADLRVLQRCTLLETMARELLTDVDVQRTDDGVHARTPAAKGRRTYLHEWLFGILSRTCAYAQVPLGAILPRGQDDLWSTSRVWANWRNAVAHEGRLDPNNPGSYFKQIEAVTSAALSVGGVTSIEEGLLEYDAALAACVELTLLASVATVA